MEINQSLKGDCGIDTFAIKKVHSIRVEKVATKQAANVLSGREWNYLSDLHRKYFPNVLLLNKYCGNYNNT